MIGFLRGIIRNQSPPHLLIEVNGVGYEVQAPMTTFYQLPEDDQPILLYTHFSVREDAQQLFGFINENDRTLFRILIKINGVGPKLALSILSSIEHTIFFQAIHNQDASPLVKIPGVGKKTAERLVIECRDSIKKIAPTPQENSKTPCVNAKDGEDAVDALLALGYKAQEAKKAIDEIYQSGDSTQTLIRRALQHMVTR